MAEEVTHGKILEFAQDASFIEKVPQERYDFIIAMLRQDPELFYKFNRLTPDQFDRLLDLIEPSLPERPQSPGYRLSLTLRYLSSSRHDAISSMIFPFTLESEIDDIVLGTSKIITRVLKHRVLMFSRLKMNLLGLAKGFDGIWNFPNCVGALDARRIICQRPIEGPQPSDDTAIEEKYFDYSFAIICDPFCRFIQLPVEITFRGNSLWGLEQIRILRDMHDLEVAKYPHLNQNLPMVVVGESNFPLNKNIMCPILTPTMSWHEYTYNIRHWRAMRPAKVALGLLFSRWKIFQSPIKGDEDKIRCILNCTVLLHNWLIDEVIDVPTMRIVCYKELRDEHKCHVPSTDNHYLPLNIMGYLDAETGYHLDQVWESRSTTAGVTPLLYSDNEESKSGSVIRLLFRRYFLKEGNIPALMRMMGVPNLDEEE